MHVFNIYSHQNQNSGVVPINFNSFLGFLSLGLFFVVFLLFPYEIISTKFMSTNLFRLLSKSQKISVSKSFTSQAIGHYNTLKWQDYKQNHYPIANINIVTFNLLAPCYKRLSIVNQITGHREREASFPEMWTERQTEQITFFEHFIYPTISIIALQEYWLDNNYSNIFEQSLQQHGYDFRSLQRTGEKTDAVGLAVKKDSFTVMGRDDITLGSIGDRVALLLWLKHKFTGKDILIANTHLSFPHTALDRISQVRQMKKLTAVMDKYATDNYVDHATRIIVGDFNVPGESPVCDHLRSEGYFSCLEVSPPRNAEEATSKSVFLLPEIPSLDRSSSSSSTNSISSNSSNNSSTNSININQIDLESKLIEESATLQSIVPINQPPEITNPISRYQVNFISHRTHRREDLGCDHIFVKPEFEFVCESISESACLEIVSSASSLSSSRTNSARAAASTTTSASSSANAAKEGLKEIQSPKIYLSGGVFVEETEVLPYHLPCNAWKTSLTISDHRPVGASLIIARNKFENKRMQS